MQIVHGTGGFSSVLIIFWGDRPVHKLPFGQSLMKYFLYSTQLTKTTSFDRLPCLIYYIGPAC